MARHKLKKISIIIINRSNYARLKPVLEELKKSKKLKLSLIAGSSSILSKYGNVAEEIKKDKYKINYEFYSHIAGENNQSMIKSTGLLILELSSILSKEKPDLVLISGDRFETLAAGMTASYLNISICHVMGGELTGTIDEKIRHSLTKLSDFHFPSTIRSKKIIIQMGENPKNVYNVGCPSIDLIKKINFKEKTNLSDYNYGRRYKVDLKKEYLMVLLHPDTTNYKNNLKLVLETCKALKYVKKQIIWLWPNIDAGADLISKKVGDYVDKHNNMKINFYSHFKAVDYLKLLKGSLCLIGNSSSGIREASYLGVPVVNIGNRQIHRERSENVLDVEENYLEIKKAIDKQIKIKRYRPSKLYGAGNSSKKIVKILENLNPQIIKKFFINFNE